MTQTAPTIHCYGKCCNWRGRCLRYFELQCEGKKVDIVSCTLNGGHPLFEQVIPIVQVNQSKENEQRVQA
jgi:hypothetical protein